MRSFLRGIAAGFTLSLMRAPLGLDFVQWPAVSGTAAYRVRAVALVVMALAIAPWMRSDIGVTLLAGTATGYALHGLVLGDIVSSGSRLELAFTLFVGALLVYWLRERKRRKDVEGASMPATAPTATRTTPPSATPPAPPTLLEMLGILVAAAGASLSVEAIARHLRLLGGGERADDSVYGTVLLVGIAFGAASFGWLSRVRALRTLILPVFLLLAAASTFASLHLLATLADYRGLDAYLHHYGLSTADHGMLAYDALLAGSMFVVPALAIGTALAAASGGGRVLAALVGASVGLYYVPSIVATHADATVTAKTLFSSQLVPIATLVAAGGAALAVVAQKELGAAARWSGLALVIGAACLPLAVETKPIVLLSPWKKFPVMPFVTLDMPEGLLTVEPSPGGLKLAKLDGRALSPETERANADAELLRASIVLAGKEREVRDVLLIGQMTPLRWVALSRAGIASADRTGAWSDAMARIEAELFGESAKPPGEVLSLSEARARMRDGRYALVIAPPASGDLPRFDGDSTPERTPVAAWFYADRMRANWNYDTALAVSGDGFEHPALALTRLCLAEEPSPTAPLLVRVGSRARVTLPIDRLLARAPERTDRARADWAARLARGERGGPHEKLMRGLELLYAAQERSSPFESKEEQVELPTEALEMLAASALEEPDNAFVRAMWDALARTLAGKRWIEEIQKIVAPIAERYRPWPTLEKALAHAELEALEPEAAARRLAPLAAAEPKDFGLWYYLGEAQSQAGLHAASAASFEHALTLKPDHEPTRRKHAMALVRIGDPKGKARIADLLREHPGDAALERFLGDGPYPEPEIGYTPESWSDEPAR